MRKSLLFIIFTVLISFILIGCSDNGSDASGEDGDYGTITVFSPETPETTRRLADKFEELYGGTVDVHYAGTNVLLNQLMAEKGNPSADVLYAGGGNLSFEGAIEEDIFEPFVPDNVADMPVIDESGVKIRHEDDYYSGIIKLLTGFSYDPEVLSEEEVPQTWDELLDPKWQGKIQFPNPASSGTATLLVLAYMSEYGEEAGWEYFEQLAQQANSIPDSGSGPVTAVANGEAEIGIGLSYHAYDLAENGESVDFIVPDMTTVVSDPISLVKDGPNPDGGKKFIEFMHTPEAQEILADTYHLVVNEEVEEKLPIDMDEIEDRIVELDMEWIQENYDRIRNEWQERIQ
ncbi:ABC transporter substrate-binding protein [Oceanobacillus jeddahense]|uniref:ABC transporter substrate-binding protein n=1 Tax=Oceanobacillus jeddahense TaxID=1462527 RepID=UPI0005960925|nr:extracellular solute-binding protein [Oceanobacillus jeddahense]